MKPEPNCWRALLRTMGMPKQIPPPSKMMLASRKTKMPPLMNQRVLTGTVEAIGELWSLQVALKCTAAH
jgi:hypothetical protein